MSTLELDVFGTPAPQGSKRGFYNQRTARVQMVESSNKVKPWRQDVKTAALAAISAQPTRWEPYVDDVILEVTFYLPRPAGHYGTGRNAQQLKDSSPRRPSKKPDLDKLLRSSLDALGEAGVWRDDSQVVAILARKHYADQRPPGAHFQIRGQAPSRAAGQVTTQEALIR